MGKSAEFSQGELSLGKRVGKSILGWSRSSRLRLNINFNQKEMCFRKLWGLGSLIQGRPKGKALGGIGKFFSQGQLGSCTRSLYLPATKDMNL